MSEVSVAVIEAVGLAIILTINGSQAEDHCNDNELYNKI